MAWRDALNVMPRQDFQTAAEVLAQRLLHSAKPHSRILPQRGREMNVQRALTKKEKIIVLAAMAIILILIGLTRPLWAPKNSSNEGGSQTSVTSVTEGNSGITAESSVAVSGE